MSTKPETRFYTGVHRLLPAVVHREKMCNPYRGGTADVWYSGAGGDLWVEYKWVERVPVRAPIRVSRELSSLQLQWLQARFDEGRNVVVILGTPQGAWVYEARAWESEPVTSADLRARGLTRAQVADYIARRTLTPCSSACSPPR